MGRRKATLDEALKNENIKWETDSNKEAWTFYKLFYKDILGDIIDFDNLGFVRGIYYRISAPFLKDNNYIEDICFGGDVVINLKHLPSEYEGIKDKHYSIFNMAIMPIQGNLQGAKQKCGRDRLDQFLLCLDCHYKAIDKEEDTLLLKRAKNRNNLSFTRCFLEFAGMEKQATGIYLSVSPEERIFNYCKKMYGIEKELVTDLLFFARKSDNDYLGYIELAKEFWKMREKLYKDICTGDYLCI